MKVRLLADDSKIPNLAIMKISSYHKKKGDDVEWYTPIVDYYDTDILYHSRIFTWTPKYQYYPATGIVKKGGTGFDVTTKLEPEIDAVTDLDYSLYPECDYSIVFLSRGCIRNCGFCVVRKKEGLIHKVAPPKLNPKGKWIMLLDNNFFACKEWKENIEILKQWNQPVDFTQGIDLRLFNDEQGEAMKKIKIKGVHCAWDNYSDKEKILPKIRHLCKYVKPYKITVYCLVGFENKEIVETDLERVLTLRELGVNPFAMGYIDFNNPDYEKTQSVKDFCRWVNRKELFKSCTWEEYRKGRRDVSNSDD